MLLLYLIINVTVSGTFITLYLLLMQAFHRHIPIVIRALGQSYSQLLQIISDPPQGSENLLALVGSISISILKIYFDIGIHFFCLFFNDTDSFVFWQGAANTDSRGNSFS